MPATTPADLPVGAILFGATENTHQVIGVRADGTEKVLTTLPIHRANTYAWSHKSQWAKGCVVRPVAP